MTASPKSYQDLDVWKIAMELAEAIYRATASFPPSEIYGLTSQMRRASVSIPSNIAEGYGRESTSAFIQFLRVAQGSLKELETQLILSSRVGLLHTEGHAALQENADRIARMLRNLIRALQSKERSA